jgi:hypothetical protein
LVDGGGHRESGDWQGPSGGGEGQQRHLVRQRWPGVVPNREKHQEVAPTPATGEEAEQRAQPTGRHIEWWRWPGSGSAVAAVA